MAWSRSRPRRLRAPGPSRPPHRLPTGPGSARPSTRAGSSDVDAVTVRQDEIDDRRRGRPCRRDLERLADARRLRASKPASRRMMRSARRICGSSSTTSTRERSLTPANLDQWISRTGSGSWLPASRSRKDAPTSIRGAEEPFGDGLEEVRARDHSGHVSVVDDRDDQDAVVKEDLRELGVGVRRGRRRRARGSCAAQRARCGSGRASPASRRASGEGTRHL